MSTDTTLFKVVIRDSTVKGRKSSKGLIDQLEDEGVMKEGITGIYHCKRSLIGWS